MQTSGQRYRRDGRIRVLLLFVCLAVPVSGSPVSAQPPSFKVLALHLTAEDALSATANLTWYTTLRSTLQSRVHRPVDVFQQHVDGFRLVNTDASIALRDYLREQLRDRQPDLVIAATGGLRDFAIRYRDDLFPNAPIVAAGQSTDDSVRRLGAGVALLEFDATYPETLRLALHLHPDTTQVYVLIGRSRERIRAFDEDLERVAGRLPRTYLADQSVPDMLEIVRNIPARSVILYFNYAQSGPGPTLSELDVARLVADVSPVPVYSGLESRIGLGIVGGVVRTATQEATQLATMAARVLNGTRAQDIPVESIKLVPMFDWQQLRRWAIDETSLPAGSEIRFRIPTVWEQYRWPILGAAAVLALQTAMIVGLIVQRSRRRRIAAALHDSQVRYSLATSAGRVGVWEWEPGTERTYMDPAVHALLGHPHRDARQELGDWLQLIHPDDRAAVANRLRESIAGTDAVYEIEHRMLHVDGTVHWMLVRGSVASTSEQPTRVVGTITDITERKHAEQKLQETQRELARVARLTALGEFATSIAHELRQPLTAIISSARASMRFLSSGATADAQEALAYVLDASKRADAAIERNRELFRNRTVNKEHLDCNRLVIDAARMAAPRLESSQVSLATSLAEHLPAVEGDRIELQQVLLNLIVNAIDAMETLDPSARFMKVSTTISSSDTVRVTVTDNGVGLGDVDMQKLFAFSYTTKPNGTGIGLSISRSIVEAHGGTLRAEQNPTGGATFSFTIPAVSMSSASARRAS